MGRLRQRNKETQEAISVNIWQKNISAMLQEEETINAKTVRGKPVWCA